MVNTCLAFGFMIFDRGVGSLQRCSVLYGRAVNCSTDYYRIEKEWILCHFSIASIVLWAIS